MKLSEKVAYLKGLEEGLSLDSSNAENKLIKGIIEAFDEIVDAIETNTADLQEMSDRVDAIDVDLGDLEAILFEGFEIEEFTEEDLDELGEEPGDNFTVVYTTDDDEEEDDEELDDEAIFAAADEVVAEAEAAEAEESEPETPEEPEAPEVVEAVAEEEPEAAPVAEVAAVAAATGIAWPDDEPEEAVEVVAEEPPVVEEAPVETEIVEREAEPEEDTYEIDCPTCGFSFYIDDSIVEAGSVDCPKCGEKLEFEVEYGEE